MLSMSRSPHREVPLLVKGSASSDEPANPSTESDAASNHAGSVAGSVAGSLGVGSLPIRARSSDRSGHSMSSLTMAMERRSTHSTHTDHSEDVYSSDEENFAAEQAKSGMGMGVGFVEDDDSLSSSLREMISMGATGHSSSSSSSTSTFSLSTERDYAASSSSQGTGTGTGAGSGSGTGAGAGAGAGAVKSKLFVQTAHSPSTTTTASHGGRGLGLGSVIDLDFDMYASSSAAAAAGARAGAGAGAGGADADRSRETTPSHGQSLHMGMGSSGHGHASGVGGVGVAESGSQEKAWAFYGRDLLNLAVDYLDSSNKNILGLTAETLASRPQLPPLATIKGTASDILFSSGLPGPAALTRMSTFRLLAAEEDGEIMDDLPEFGLGTDVLGMGVNDFAVVSRSTDAIALLVRIQEVASRKSSSSSSSSSSSADSRSPRSGSGGWTPVGSTPTQPISIIAAGAGAGAGSPAISSGNFGRSASLDLEVPSRHGLRSMSEGNSNSSSSITAQCKPSKQRLCVSCRLPSETQWTAVKKVRVFQGMHVVETASDGSPRSSQAAASSRLLYRGASNAAEVSAIKALAASTAREIHDDGDSQEEQQQQQQAQQDTRKSAATTTAAAAASAKESGATWLQQQPQQQRAASSSSSFGNVLDDEASASQSEMSANDAFADGGFNDDLCGEGEGEDLDFVMDSVSVGMGDSSFTNASSSANGAGAGGFRMAGRDRKSAAASDLPRSRGSDEALFCLDMDP